MSSTSHHVEYERLERLVAQQDDRIAGLRRLLTRRAEQLAAETVKVLRLGEANRELGELLEATQAELASARHQLALCKWGKSPTGIGLTRLLAVERGPDAIDVALHRFTRQSRANRRRRS